MLSWEQALCRAQALQHAARAKRLGLGLDCLLAAAALGCFALAVFALHAILQDATTSQKDLCNVHAPLLMSAERNAPRKHALLMPSRMSYGVSRRQSRWKSSRIAHPCDPAIVDQHALMLP